MTQLKWENGFGIGYKNAAGGLTAIVNNQGKINLDLLTTWDCQTVEFSTLDLSTYGKDYKTLLATKNPGFYNAPKMENRDNDGFYLVLTGGKVVRIGDAI